MSYLAETKLAECDYRPQWYDDVRNTESVIPSPLKLCPSLLTLRIPAPEQSIYWNVKHSLRASISINNHQNALEVWVTQPYCTNTQSAVKKNSEMRNESKIEILCASESKSCSKEVELVSFSCKTLIQNFLRTLFCAMSDWKGIWGFPYYTGPWGGTNLIGQTVDQNLFFVNSSYRMLCVFLIMRESFCVLQQSTIMIPVVSRSCVYRWGTRCTYLRNWKVSEAEHTACPDTSLFFLFCASWT